MSALDLHSAFQFFLMLYIFITNVLFKIFQSMTDGEHSTLEFDEMDFKCINPKAFIKVSGGMQWNTAFVLSFMSDC